MKLILLSGGSGKRLWPLSNDARSKQFLKILRNPDGNMESMVQRIWRQLTHLGLSEHCTIATSSNQVDMLTSQIGPDVPIIIEPERRDTFPAIALAASYLYSIKGVSLNETIIVLPVDPYVEDSFFHIIDELDMFLSTSSTELALVGVHPSYPSAKYGYIVPEAAVGEVEFSTVQSFYEKPNEEKASELIAQRNALWNCGVFAFKLDYLITLLYEQGIPIQYELLAKQYHRLKKTSFDFEVVEKCKSVSVISYKGYWKDLGTWNTLTEEMAVSKIGNGIISEDSQNTHLINEMNIPVTILGLSNVVVAVSPDGILVSDKAASQRLKEFITFEQIPMYEEHLWGTRKVLDYAVLADGNEVLTQRLSISAGKHKGIEVHFKRTETWTIVSGRGEIYLDGKMIVVQQGMTVQILPKMKHGIKAITDMEMVEIQTGSQLNVGDLVEFSYSWGSAVI